MATETLDENTRPVDADLDQNQLKPTTHSIRDSSRVYHEMDAESVEDDLGETSIVDVDGLSGEDTVDGMDDIETELDDETRENMQELQVIDDSAENSARPDSAEHKTGMPITDHGAIPHLSPGKESAKETVEETTGNDIKSQSESKLDENVPIVRPIVYGSHSRLLTDQERKKAPAGHTHRWKLFVHGYQGQDISHWCERVVFHLHSSFKDAHRSVYSPPYEVYETGWGEFECGIDLHFKDPRVKHCSIYHLLKLFPFNLNPNEPVTQSPDEPVVYELYDELVFIVPRTELIQKGFDDYEQLTEKPTFPVVCSKNFTEQSKEEEADNILRAYRIIEERLATMNKRKEELHAQVCQLRKQVKEYKNQQIGKHRLSISASDVAGNEPMNNASKEL